MSPGNVQMRAPPFRLACSGAVAAVDEIGCTFGQRLVREARQRDMIWGLVADGIGRRSVTRDRQRLTSAAAPVDLPPLTRPTGLRHPGGATERVEGRRIPPYLADRSLADRFEYHPRKRFRSMARQHLARRGDVQEATPPP